MYKKKKIGIVVAAYNEENFILKVITTMPSFVDCIIVIDDASTDSTFSIANSSNDPRVEVIRHKKNKGVGGAVFTGHKRVIEKKCDISVTMAGDAQMDPKYLPLLLDAIIEEGYDYAKGNRFLHKAELRKMPFSRKIG